MSLKTVMISQARMRELEYIEQNFGKIVSDVSKKLARKSISQMLEELVYNDMSYDATSYIDVQRDRDATHTQSRNPSPVHASINK